MDDYFNRERERERLWGPSPQKVSWTELCKRLIAKDPAFAEEISFDGSPPFMSDQILNLVGGKHNFGTWDQKATKILTSLRPVDAIHVPQLRFDCETGKIVEWNRSMSDLSGISAAQVVGKTYAEVLEEFIPNLSKEYKEAAVEWVKMEEDDKLGHLNPNSRDYAENCRAGYLFPLPLPLRYDSSFKYVSGRNRHYDEYIELLAARSNRLFDLYPKLSDFRPVPQCKRGEEGTHVWNFDTSGWVGGIEFTLRRKQYLPSLQTLCRELLPKGADHAVNEDGSLAVTKSLAETSVTATSSKDEDDVYTTISKYMRSCGPIGIKYIREVMNAVCKKCRNQYNMRIKLFHFSTDWSTHAETAAIHKHVFQALGGADLITEKVEKDKMMWTLNFGPEKYEGDDDLPKYKLKDRQEIQQRKILDTWSDFKKWITPVLRENKNVILPCGASDSTFVLPTADKPELTVLTLKIEGHERTDGSDEEEEFKAFATVQVPASLNFFQLHRVVCQTMNCRSSGTRETHEWTVPNIASANEKPITDENLDYVTLGETYLVEDGERMHDDWGCKEVFDTGGGIRQRVSRTGAYVDQDMPFYFLSSDDEFGPSMLESRSVGQIKACIHSTCINSVFFQPGAVALMKDGLVKYSTTYKITCTKSEQYTGPLPLNPDINVIQPKCLRGKPEQGHEYWSVDLANNHLHQDRGCLRRNLCKVGADDYLVQMPWCQLQKWPINREHTRGGAQNHAPYPVAVHLTGLDHYPMFLRGEPPLPSSEAYEDYVSTLNGRIDPRFLQENVMDFGGYFAVPFEYGAPGRGGYSYDSDDNESGQSCAIGQVWTREVDEEMKRIDSLQPIKKAKGKKRKAPSKTPARDV